jgi:hypothetical protein
VDFVLTISTLGLREVQDGMYVEIARGNYERAGLYTFAMITGMICGITFGVICGGLRRALFLLHAKCLVNDPVPARRSAGLAVGLPIHFLGV